ncbi:MAG: hypothetical protein ABIM89_10400 [Mycobacteriales bacterium]
MPRFRPVLGAFATSGCFAVATVVWLVGGASLPGGRWFAVHLFTLGVLTNLIAALMPHFAAALLHSSASSPRRVAGHLLARNGGALAVLVGLPTGRTALVGAGATVLAADIFAVYAELRRMRKRALPTPYAFVVRAYERACSAFLHGAVLGALLGSGTLSGSWYASGRTAHLLILVLGWGGTTLLATLVTFGPGMMHVPMQRGRADLSAAALRRAHYGLTIAVIAMLATGVGGIAAGGAKGVATVGMILYAASAYDLCRPVLLAGNARVCSGVVAFVQSACVWFLLACYLATLFVITGRGGLLDAAGVALLVGSFVQSLLTSAAHLLPMLWGSDAADRAFRLGELGRLPAVRPILLNVGTFVLVLSVIAGGAAGRFGAFAVRVGWLAVAAAVIATAALFVRARFAHPPGALSTTSEALRLPRLVGS